MRSLRNRYFILVALIFFVLGQGFFTYKGIENFPFVHWGMYSGPSYAQESYSGFEIYVDGNKLDVNSLSDAQRELIESSLQHYTKLLDNGDPKTDVFDRRFAGFENSATYEKARERLLHSYEDINAYPDWLKNYLLENDLLESDIEVFRLVYVYRESQVEAIDKQLLFSR